MGSVLTASPQSAWARDGTGRLPLQRALERAAKVGSSPGAGRERKQAERDLVSLVWQRLWERGLADGPGRTPTSTLFFKTERGEEMEAKALEKTRFLLAAGKSHKEGADELMAILRACPEVARRFDEAGLLPLHYALHSLCRSEDVESLLRLWLDAAAVTDTAGWLPLHWALYRGAPQAVVSLLTRAHPEAAMHGPTLPLHVAVLSRATPGTVRAVLKVYPEAVQNPPGDGMPTIQWAMYHEAKAEVQSTSDLLPPLPYAPPPRR